MIHTLVVQLALLYVLFGSLQEASLRRQVMESFYEQLSRDRYARLGEVPRRPYGVASEPWSELPPLGDFGAAYAKRQHAPVLCFAWQHLEISLDPSLACL